MFLNFHLGRECGRSRVRASVRFSVADSHYLPYPFFAHKDCRLDHLLMFFLFHCTFGHHWIMKFIRVYPLQCLMM